VEILRTSRDPDELKHVWVEWKKVSGEKCRGMFEHYVALSNEAATLNSEYRHQPFITVCVNILA
jgi:peptidyl-dipeptidase A